MEDSVHRAIAIVGAGAVLPDAPNVAAFWNNIKTGRYCISEVTADRWNPEYYYDADHNAPDKTYSKIGGWVREFPWDPMKWRLPIPPRVAQAMDQAQQWALACTREALEDYGYPNRPLNADRTAVILGNAMAGEKHYLTALRVYFPEYEHELKECTSFAGLLEELREEIACELHNRMGKRLPEITEDSMPGELANCLAGRIANVYNFHGPNFTADAACASTMAGLSAAVHGLVEHDFDSVIAGGIDRNMGAPTFVKFCKIGALSATGTRPYAEGADGFVMGEGAAIFVLKRLADAERDEDKIYAVLRGIGGSSDGKGKGITAPNPIGQRFAIQRAWENAGLSPATVTMMEGHGTSTRVGDVVEVQSMVDVLGGFNLPQASVALGSVKSNIGHLKGAAGAAGMLKTILSLRDKVLPPSVNCEHTNPEIDFAHSPFYVNRELKPWDVPEGVARRAGLSAFGFGGTNFHLVLEEHIPHKLNGNGKHTVAVGEVPAAVTKSGDGMQAGGSRKAPLRGALLIGAEDAVGLGERLHKVQEDALAGRVPVTAAPAESDLCAQERLAIDYASAAELADRAGKALKALVANQAPIWKALRAQGIFRGNGPAPKVAFLYTGQGSQYVNMVQDLRAVEPVVAETFAEADRVLTPLLGKPLSEFIFIDGADPEAVAKAEDDLRQTAITQPAVIATDVAITRLLAAYGIRPDMAMGHSVGEYGALVASGALPFDDAMEAVSARGREMTHVSLGDNGGMAAVFAPLEEIERLLKTIEGYVVIANINSKSQAVIGGASGAIKQAIEAFLNAGYNAVLLPVSHAFHTAIVAGASEPLKRMLERLRLQTPVVPIVANIDGDFYPTGKDAKAQMVEMLAKQVASPVQFVKGLERLYEAGARVFVETGPKKALQGFAEDVLGDRGDVVSLFTNHPKLGDTVAFNQALCGLYAAGLGGEQTRSESELAVRKQTAETRIPAIVQADGNSEQGEMKNRVEASMVITGAALGLPGTEHIFDDGNIGRLLNGEQLIDVIPTRFRRAMLDKHITRLVKNENGGAFETIDRLEDGIKLAGRGGAFNIETEFGLSAERTAALDRVTCLAIGAGIDALRDAGIPLVMHYKTTSKGTQLPDRWMLPGELRDNTGIIFASAFPGYDSFAEMMSDYYEDRIRREQLGALESLQARTAEAKGDSVLVQEINRRICELKSAVAKNPYMFDRRFLFRVLSMGHSQFAEYIGARGPNTQVNAACASTAQAVALAEDWIGAGRCRRVVVISADDVTSDHLLEWMGAGFLASGAAATDAVVEDAAIPFDKRRHGMIVGMGAGALVLESAEAAGERGIQPICEVLSTVTANSAFHGTRLDVQHIGQMMEDLVAKAEAGHGVARGEMASRMVFVSHETYTPARGGSASAEINALRRVFGEDADKIVIANTKGFTGHAMGAGVEDVIAVKSLETGCVPPVANFKEVDPELGALNLSKGGVYPIEYALRLAAGFGSQISMTLLRWVATKNGIHAGANELGYAYRVADAKVRNEWLARMGGKASAELEVVNRTLRVRDVRVSVKTPDVVQELLPVVVETRPVEIPVEMPMIEIHSTIGAKSSDTADAIPETNVTVRVVAASLPTDSSPMPPSQTDDGVKERVLALVSERTGYPIDMLDLELDLEADLGVDTVKQAELLATIREAYGIARDDQIKLRDFPTLSHVIRFVHEKRPNFAGTVDSSSKGAPSEVNTAVAMPTTVVEASPAVALVAAAAPVTERVSTLVMEAATDDSVKEKVLEIVAAKTGYPKDMLDLDLDLEADLGVDTVKQAEMFAAVRAAYNIPRDENLKLRDFPTLAHVIKFAHDRLPGSAATAVKAPVAASTSAAESMGSPSAAVITGESIKDMVLEIVAAKTGYPKDMLDLDLDLEADLGVDTVKQAEMFAAVRAAYNIPRDENLKLRDFPTLAHVIKFAHDRQTVSAAVIEAAQPKVEVAAVTPVAESMGSPSVEVVTDESIKERVLEIVAAKTGYPKDMLDLDLDLEADLGVDTVKQAEMFAAVRAAYNIPRDENLKLRDFPTLAHVIKFAHDRQTVSAAVAEAKSVEEVPVVTPVVESTGTPTVVEAVTEDSIKDKVLEIVATKTGYPKDMLDLDLDLEADLGVDTVKQAEMFAAVRAAYNIPRDENLKLRDFPTLAHVIKFAHDRLPAQVVAQAAPAAAVEAGRVHGAVTAARQHPALASFDAANSIPRRVPMPILRPALEVCKSTGVVLGAGSRVVLMPDRAGVADALTQKLQAIGAEVLRIDRALDADALVNCLGDWMAAGPVQGVYWLAALDNEGSLSAMTPDGWHAALWVRAKALYHTMRTLYDQIAAPGTFLVSATRMGGQHGYDAAGAVAPLGGPVVGITKTYKRERGDVLSKAIDFEAGRETQEVADTLIEETLRDPGAVEIGYKDGARWSVGLQERSAVDGRAGMTLDSNSVFVVTGAAGSIVSAITTDLAQASGGTFYLLDLVPEPDPGNQDLVRFASDKEGLKRDLFKRIQDRGERATPALVEKELAGLERAQAALTAINAVREAGGTAHYFSVNLTNTDGVARVIEEVRKRSGRIDVLLHAAGMERSHFLPDKDPREFDLIFDVKSDGWFNLLHAIGDMPVGATVAFSSIAGRFGNGGQADYSSANDLLCKITSSFRTTRTETRGIAIDWTAWKGIGMATRGSIPKMMEVAGIDMLPAEAGVPLIRRELTEGGTRGEILIGQRLGILMNEFDATGGLDVDLVADSGGKFTSEHGPMIGRVVSYGLHSGLKIETTLDPRTQAFLHDHQIGGTPVLPGVMGIEAFAEAALLMLPGWHIDAVEDVRFLAPFKFYRNETRTLTIEAEICQQADGVWAECRLLGHRTLMKHSEPEITTHFTGRVRLVKQAPAEVAAQRFAIPRGATMQAEDIYKIYFHGPAYQVLEHAWKNGSGVVGQMAENLPAHHQPSDRKTVLAPRLIELCFQTAGLWGIITEGSMGLPQRVRRVCLRKSADLAKGPMLFAVVSVDPEQGSFGADVVDTDGNLYLRVEGYETVTLPGSVDGELLKALQGVALAA